MCAALSDAAGVFLEKLSGNVLLSQKKYGFHRASLLSVAGGRSRRPSDINTSDIAGRLRN